MSYINVIEDIETLSHYREYKCKNCGHNQKAYVLTIQEKCEKCGQIGKLRGYSAIGSEIEDVVDAVLAWLGQGDDFESAMERKRVIDLETS
jgi:ribosomal protein S27E